MFSYIDYGSLRFSKITSRMISVSYYEFEHFNRLDSRNIHTMFQTFGCSKNTTEQYKRISYSSNISYPDLFEVNVNYIMSQIQKIQKIWRGYKSRKTCNMQRMKKGINRLKKNWIYVSSNPYHKIGMCVLMNRAISACV